MDSEPGGADYSFIRGTKDYNRIYLSKTSTKSVKAIIEKTTSSQNEFIAANYTGFSSNICRSFENYADTVGGITGFSTCVNFSNSYYIVSDIQGMLDAWPDFTAKIRIS